MSEDFLSDSKPEGVVVYLWENHFNDKGSNCNHSVVFGGNLDVLDAMYARGNDAA